MANEVKLRLVSRMDDDQMWSLNRLSLVWPRRLIGV